MVKYDLQALINRFDVRATEAGEGAVVGALSSLIGESLLLDLLAHALRKQRHTVELLPGKPRRDDEAFKKYGLARPSFRDLDAWLLIDGAVLAAVECKHWTSSSNGFTDVGEDTKSYAMRRWNLLHKEDLDAPRWTSASKVALPLLPPAGWDALPVDMRRILAIWTPISSDGESPLSRTRTTSPISGNYQTVAIEVFSGSLHARALLPSEPYLEAATSNVKSRLDALDVLLNRVVGSPDESASR